MSWHNLKQKFDAAIIGVQNENFEIVGDLRVELEEFFTNNNKMSDSEIEEFKNLNKNLKEEIEKKITGYNESLEFAMNIPKNYNKYLSAMRLVEGN